ncbi:MAG: O-antigen ligase family protein [Planctomycetes bacterium]|nr:O-antigen ligase family protein [Planctomycetota bacterium]
MNRSKRRVLIAGWILLLSGAVLTPLTYGPADSPRWALPALLFFAAALLVPIRLRLTRASLRVPVLPLMPPLLLGIVGLLQILPLPSSLIQAISPERARLTEVAFEDLGGPPAWYPLSLDVDATAVHAVRWFSYAAAAFAVAAWTRRRRQARKLATALFALAVAESLFGIVANAARWPDMTGLPYWWQRGAVGTLSDRNHFAAFAATGLLAGLGLLADRMRRVSLWTRGDWIGAVNSPEFGKRLVIALGIALCAGGVVASMSRAGALTAICGFAFFASLLFVIGPSDRSNRLRLLFLVLVGILVMALLVGIEPIARRFGELSRPPREHGVSRTEVWTIAWKIWERFPATGSGLGTYRLAQAPHWPIGRNHPHLDYAHNDLLEALSTTGPAGVILYVLALALAGWALARRALSRRNALLAGMIALLAAGLAHGQVDFPWQIPGNGTWYFLFLGLALSPAFRPGRLIPRPRREFVPVATAGLGLVLTLILLAPSTRSTRDAALRAPASAQPQLMLAAEAQAQGDWIASDRAHARARRLQPSEVHVQKVVLAYWLTRVKDNATVALEEIAQSAGPLLWSEHAGPHAVFNQVRTAAGNPFLSRLLPPPEHPARGRWEMILSKYRRDMRLPE